MSASHLRALRSAVAPYRERPTWTAVVHMAFACVAYALAFGGALTAHALTHKLVFGLFVGLASGNLFMMGHDACHGSLTRHPLLNKVLGRIAFLPSYHPFSVWALTHNRIHHVYTNLRGVDFVWAPLSRAEYEARSAVGRFVYRASRTPLGLALYYPIELWWVRLFFPRAVHLDRRRSVYRLDCILVAAWMVAQLALVVAAADRAVPRGTIGGVLEGLVAAVLVPWAVFAWEIGFVTFFNHTHPRVRWFAGRDEWSAEAGTFDGTVCLEFPRWTRAFASNIMNHVAHHLDPAIPLVRLREAEDRIHRELGDRIVVQAWDVRELAGILRRCRLYDYDARRWTDYDGSPTSEAWIAPRGIDTHEEEPCPPVCPPEPSSSPSAPSRARSSPPSPP